MLQEPMLRGLAVVLYVHKRDSCWLGRSCGSIVPRLLARPSLLSGPVFFLCLWTVCASCILQLPHLIVLVQRPIVQLPCLCW